MTTIEELIVDLRRSPRTWLVTGAAGFIGSNLVEQLLRCGQEVVGLDSFATGHQRNLDEVRDLVGPEAWSRFQFVRGDLARIEDCRAAMAGIQLVLHQAAIGSVPRSMTDPLESHHANVTGTLNLLQAAREIGVQRFVYASSSAVYGDDPVLPKVESQIGCCLSPYAVTKLANELYAAIFCRCYGLSAVGLRYFNVFGPRQDPHGAYAAVIPRWIDALLEELPVVINGDGETSRDFCHVLNVVQGNLLAACRPLPAARHEVYNLAVGSSTTLNQLFALIQSTLATQVVPAAVRSATPVYQDFRAGDVRHSLANITAAQEALGFAPTHDVARGLAETIAWYVADFHKRHAGG